MSNGLLTTLKKLRLSGLAESLEIRLHEAATTGRNHREFLELLQDELMIRNHRLVSRRTNAAGFRETRKLEDFDFGFNPSIKKGSRGRRLLIESQVGDFARRLHPQNLPNEIVHLNDCRSPAPILRAPQASLKDQIRRQTGRRGPKEMRAVIPMTPREDHCARAVRRD